MTRHILRPDRALVGPGGPAPRRLGKRVLVALGSGFLVVGALAGPAAATPTSPTPITPAGSTVANVNVLSGISLTGLDESFSLTGPTGSTATSVPVNYTVETNSPSGYTVTVASRSDVLAPVGASLDTIPIADLKVLPAGGSYTSVSQSPGEVYSGPRSALHGDALSNTYRMRIPAVAVDTYQAVLDYVVSAGA